MRIVETREFTDQIERWLSEDEYRSFQLALVLRPEQGRLIRGSGGLRKVRWRSGRRGKRGGIRVIYYWASGESAIYLLFAYAKTAREDLTRNQLRILRRIVAEELE